jgi:hypothetical protein
MFSLSDKKVYTMGCCPSHPLSTGWHIYYASICLLTGKQKDYQVPVPKTDHSTYRGADKPLARPTSRCIVFDGENISFDASLVIYIKIVLIFLQL